MWRQQVLPCTRVQQILANRCQTSIRHPLLGYQPDPVRCVQRLDLTDFKLRAALYHAHAVEGLGESAELLFELNAFIMETRSVWDMLRFELAHFYCFYDDWVAKHDSKELENRILRHDPELWNLRQKMWLEHWFRALTAVRHYIAHQGALLGHVEVQITESIGGGNPTEVSVERSLAEAEFLLETDFREFEHNKPAYVQARTHEYFDNMVQVVDTIRQYAIDHSPLFDAGLWRPGGVV